MIEAQPRPEKARPCRGGERVAETILSAAAKPTREARVGSMAKVNTFAVKNLPGVADRMAAKQVENLRREEPAQNREGALHSPGESGRSHGDHGR